LEWIIGDNNIDDTMILFTVILDGKRYWGCFKTLHWEFKSESCM